MRKTSMRRKALGSLMTTMRLLESGTLPEEHVKYGIFYTFTEEKVRCFAEKFVRNLETGIEDLMSYSEVMKHVDLTMEMSSVREKKVRGFRIVVSKSEAISLIEANLGPVESDEEEEISGNEGGSRFLGIFTWPNSREGLRS